MSLMIPFIEILDRAHTGPLCEVKDWDIKRIPGTIKEELKEHGLNGTCDPKNPINTDDGLADEFWQAGFGLAVKLGMICLDTKRIIKFTEEELKEIIKGASSEITIGGGKERVTFRSRRPEDRERPKFRSCFGIVSEDLYIPLLQAIAQNRIIDFISPPSLATIYNKELKMATPYETLAGYRESVMVKEALRKAGRVGCPVLGVATSPTEYGQFGGYGIPGGLDPKMDVGLILAISELKTSYSLLHKVAHIVANCGGMVGSGHSSMIGGYVGPAEGAAIATIAACILQIAVHQATLPNGYVFDLRYHGNCGRDAVWASSIIHQAQSRNTNMLESGVTSQVSGPCTYEILYEMAVGSINDAVSGCAWQWGNRPAAGIVVNHMSPLEQKFGAQVLKACAGMKREEANEIVKALIPKYEDKLKNPPKGKSFIECTDLKTLQPTKEWQDIYERVWKELEDLGLPRL